MERIYAVVIIGLALLGHTLSQYDGSGGGDEDYEEEDDFEEESGGGTSSLTACQQMKSEYRKTKDNYDPQCLPDGQFAPLQCYQSVCWCVDQQGKEIRGTKGVANCNAYVHDTDITIEESREVKTVDNENNMLNHPGVLAGVIGGIVICLLCAVLIVMFIVYRMKKKDEGSYILGRAERKNSRSVIYTKAVPRDQEFYA